MLVRKLCIVTISRSPYVTLTVNMIIQMITPLYNDIFMSLVSQAYSKNYLFVYSKSSTAQEIENIIHSLKAKDSCGYDEISTQIMKLRKFIHGTILL
jgi:hypothetical protein